MFKRQMYGRAGFNSYGNASYWREPGRDGAGRIRTGVLPHAVKARQPLRYEPHPARDHTSTLTTALWILPR